MKRLLDSLEFWIVLIMAIGLAGAWFVWDPANKTPSVAAFAAAMATIGWLVQRHNQIALSQNQHSLQVSLSRKQHTLNMLLQLRTGALFNDHRTLLFSHYPAGHKVPKEDVAQLVAARTDKANYGRTDDGKPKLPIIESFMYIANFYEFLAAATRNGDLDKKMFEDSIGAILVQFYDHFEPLIQDFQKRDETGKPTNRAFEHLEWLVADFRQKTKPRT